MSRIWGRIFPDWTLPPLDLWKDNLCGSGKTTENRSFCALGRHCWKACLQGSSWFCDVGKTDLIVGISVEDERIANFILQTQTWDIWTNEFSGR
jgi:hypothetical protein